MKDKQDTYDENTKDVETSSKSNAHTDSNDEHHVNKKHGQKGSAHHSHDSNTIAQDVDTDRQAGGEILETNARNKAAAGKVSTSTEITSRTRSMPRKNSTGEPSQHQPNTGEIRQRKIGTVEMLPRNLEIGEKQPRKISRDEMRQHKISSAEIRPYMLSTGQKQNQRQISRDEMRQRKISTIETRAHKLSIGERQQRKISTDEMRHRKISIGERQQRKMSSEEMRQRSHAGTLSRRDHHAGSGTASVGTNDRQYTHPFIHLENTYCLEPEERFPEYEVRNLLTQMLDDFLKNKHEYSAFGMKNASLQLSEMIKSRVLELNCRRFKIVVLVHVGQRKEHGVQIVSRCLWDTHWDKHISVNLKTPQWYAEATVFAVYYE